MILKYFMVMIQIPTQKSGSIPYQDLWLQGSTIAKGLRECQARFESIYAICKEYKRPITVLDIGADMGYFSFRLQDKLPGTYVLIEADPATLDSLILLCEYNAHPKTILLSKQVSLCDLKILKEKEYFDVVLALSVIHHFKEPAQDVLQTLATLGTHLFFEPPSNEEVSLELDLDLFNAKPIATCQSAFSQALGAKNDKKTICKV